ncbi:MAG: Eco57I restriction-modification methylase domain-containing protein [Deltaproteobacteria bacterium]|nr:Eco57I restriction-modification methylase domain-containing protein [Deltaproteobacteria bacterium]
MGILHKLVFILGKLDPHNERWKQRQLDKLDSVSMREELERTFENNDDDYGRKLYLIENCIYGVDIQPIAIQISKLRFFISLICDQRTNKNKAQNCGVRPLPNLETKFVAANTLISLDRGKGQMLLTNLRLPKLEQDLAAVRHKHFAAQRRRDKLALQRRDAEIRKEIADILAGRGMSGKAAQRLAAWDPYDQNASSDFFDPEWMFGVLGGFSVTIGNPPYVRADEQSDWNRFQRKAILDSKQYETLWEKWDLYIPFIERSYKLLKPNGVTSLIVSDAYCHSKYAQKSQNWFLQNSRILRLDFFSKIKIFDAGVHNVAYFFQYADGTRNKPERRVHDPEFGAIKALPIEKQENLTYRMFFPGEKSGPDISGDTLTLADICYVSFGCRPNSDEKKAKGQFIVADLLSDVRDVKHPKGYIEAKNMCRFTYTGLRWLEYGTKRSPSLWARKTFPELFEAPEKIVAADVSGGINRAAYDNQGVFHSHTLVAVVPWHYLAAIRNKSIKKSARYEGEQPKRPDLPKREVLEETSRHFSTKYVLAVMNSTVARDFLRANRRSNIHLYPDDWKKLPIPDVPKEKQDAIVVFVDQILDLKKFNPSADVSDLEQKIDAKVTELYGLAPSRATTRKKRG